jgi:Family of unknown function (DUF5825)
VTYRLPRAAGSARTVAPAPPFTDTSAVAALASRFGSCQRLSLHELVVHCGAPEHLALGLKETGCAGLRVVVRCARPVTAACVRDLATAGVSLLEITEPVTDPVAWFETAKAAAETRLSLLWHGTLPEPVERFARHLPPPEGRPWLPGMLCWRRGPGFAEVVDRRAGHQRILADLAVLTRLFGERLDRPFSGGTADELVDAGLVAHLGGGLVWLPYRLRS